MIRGSASPAAAGGRRGGRAAGLLPASLVTVAAAALFPSRPGGRSAERTRDQNVCFPVWGETAVVKWYGLTSLGLPTICLSNSVKCLL